MPTCRLAQGAARSLASLLCFDRVGLDTAPASSVAFELVPFQGVQGTFWLPGLFLCASHVSLYYQYEPGWTLLAAGGHGRSINCLSLFRQH